MSLAIFLKRSLLRTELWDSWDCKELNNRISLPLCHFLSTATGLSPSSIVTTHSVVPWIHNISQRTHDRMRKISSTHSKHEPSSPRPLLFVFSFRYMHKDNFSDIFALFVTYKTWVCRCPQEGSWPCACISLHLLLPHKTHARLSSQEGTEWQREVTRIQLNPVLSKALLWRLPLQWNGIPKWMSWYEPFLTFTCDGKRKTVKFVSLSRSGSKDSIHTYTGFSTLLHEYYTRVATGALSN